MPKFVQGAKIAFLDFDLRTSKTRMGVQFLINDPEKLQAVRQRELDITKERIMKIINAGANVILTTKGMKSSF